MFLFFFQELGSLFRLSLFIRTIKETCISSKLNRKVSVGFTFLITYNNTIVWVVTVKQQNINLLSDKTDALSYRRVYRNPLWKIVWEMFCIQIHK